ncbi:TIGR04063 family PEP-CTERM/XrtA system glycosyltransferase [Luteithermobacter gelatinilyticus]|uniref:TIGR04063 family PEP-CTERM/XrtA system glycosyltransferase n=1 Tax=Luteithermobacter gelatinilyticus TaxID=2582913 RepID=UPI001105C7C3|nr:TIGR04063 family PEP-CTERM/XrtA system glycosyltransferase [Luteithermobacter gelatinilyticus]
MHILHVFDHSIPLHSGYTFRSYQILKEQRRLGYETLQVTGLKQHSGGQQGEGSRERVEDLEFFRTTRYNAVLNGLPVLGQMEVVRSLKKRLLEILDQNPVDVIHAHSPALNGLAALAAGRARGIPVVYEIRAFWEDAAVSHGTCREGDLRYRLSRWLETRVARQADAVTCICNGLKQDLVARGISSDKITIIPNAVDIASFSGPRAPDPDLQDRLGLRDAVTLGFIGSFYDYEGLDILLDSLPLIYQEIPQVRLLLVGGGEKAESLRHQARTLGLEDRVIFTGRVPYDQVQTYYNLVDIFVYPRKKMRLTDLVTPLKPLEAMAQHKLVAASDIGGHHELITDGVTGTLFRPDDPRDLARCLVDLLHRRDDWPAMQAAGRRYVEQERNWARSVANYPAIYARLAQPAATSRVNCA